MVSATAFAAVSFTSATKTAPPRPANRSHTARPIPDPPPATSATVPIKLTTHYLWLPDPPSPSPTHWGERGEWGCPLPWAAGPPRSNSICLYWPPWHLGG